MRPRSFASCILVCALACESASKPAPAPSEQIAAPPPAAEGAAMTFDRLEITTTNKRDTQRRWMKIKGRASFHQKLADNARVTAKISCAGEGYVLADVANVQSIQGRLQRHDAGDAADIYASFFHNAGPAVEPCQIDFAVDEPVARALGSACWRGKEVTTGPCVPAIVPKPDATAPPFAVHDFVLTATDKLDVTYMVRINQSPHPEIQLRLEAACDNFGMRSRIVDRETISNEPVMYAAGESVVRTAELGFRDAQLAKTDGGSPCEFTLWRNTKSEPAKVVLGEWCRRDGVLAEGSCGEKVPSFAAAPLDRDSFTIPIARLGLEPQRKGRGPLVEIEALVRREKATVEQPTVRATITCNLGGEQVEEKVRLVVADVNALLPGESTRLAGNADFERVGVPEWCEATFVAGEGKTQAIEIGTWCMRGTTTEHGACA